MLINEAIRRADSLVDNEYSIEEKYHWCDIVSSELKSLYARKYKRVRLFRWSDGKFLLPQDCMFEYIEKLIFMGHEIEKQDMRSFGFVTEQSGSGRTHLVYAPESAQAFVSQLEVASPSAAEMIEVVYLPPHRPIRRIFLNAEPIIVPQKDSTGKRSTLRMGTDCPFLEGDTVDVTSGDTKVTLHILSRKADFNDMELTMYYTLEYAEGEADELPSGELKADMCRIITDETVCAPPYDELYVDYICAQICFFQRKYDVYQQFISRYNERMREYGNLMKEFEAENDRTTFVNWWEL